MPFKISSNKPTPSTFTYFIVVYPHPTPLGQHPILFRLTSPPPRHLLVPLA
jgi:hypothetical protein